MLTESTQQNILETSTRNCITQENMATRGAQNKQSLYQKTTHHSLHHFVTDSHWSLRTRASGAQSQNLLLTLAGLPYGEAWPHFHRLEAASVPLIQNVGCLGFRQEPPSLYCSTEGEKYPHGVFVYLPGVPSPNTAAPVTSVSLTSTITAAGSTTAWGAGTTSETSSPAVFSSSPVLRRTSQSCVVCRNVKNCYK